MTQLFAHFIPPYFALWHMPVVFLAGMIGEGYGVVVGGGGILIQFALASLGVPLVSVVATDLAGNVGAIGGVVAAAPGSFLSHKRLTWFLGVPFFLGGIIGTIFLTRIPVNALRLLLIVALNVLLIYMFLGRKSASIASSSPSVGKKRYPLIGSIMLGLGVYLNVSGVGVGTFQRIVFAGFLRLSVIDSLVVNNVIDLPPMLFSTVVTGIAGLIAWPYVFALWAGTFIGAHVVARHIRKVPDAYLRLLLVVVTVFYLIYLIHAVLAA